MSVTKIGYLVSLDYNLNEDTSLPKLPLSQGSNVIGRGNIPVSDKRLSRKHLSLTASADGSAYLAEGTNPVVDKAGDQRKKLTSNEHVSITNGDIIELIPGHHFFKMNRRMEKEKTVRRLQVIFMCPMISYRLLFGCCKCKGCSSGKYFLCFYRGCNSGDIIVAILSNYMVDIDWLITACPILTKIPHVLVSHGEGDGTLEHMKWPEFNANLPAALGNFKINPSFFKKFDYSSAAVRLIASVPGYHTGPNLTNWGHMKLHTVLEEYTFEEEFEKSPLVYQFSSLGSLDGKWMAELSSSMSSGFSEDKIPLGLGEPLIVWPTVEDVRCSLEGYAAGSCIPSPQKNVEKAFLKNYWAKWKASHTGRCHAMPCIKTFARYNGGKLAWLTSANLSKAAWGALQKNNLQSMVRSYENKCGAIQNPEIQKTILVTLTWCGSRNANTSSEVVSLPVPYELPPQRYYSEAADVPWSWDRRYTKKDVYGQVWPQAY